VSFCLRHELLQESPQGFRFTPRGESVLEAIDRVLDQSARLDTAVRKLAVEIGAPVAASDSFAGLPRLDSFDSNGAIAASRAVPLFEVDPLGAVPASWAARSGARAAPPARLPPKVPAPPDPSDFERMRRERARR